MDIKTDIKTASALVILGDAIRARTLSKAAYAQAARYARQLRRAWDMDALYDAGSADCVELATLLERVRGMYPRARIEPTTTARQRLSITRAFIDMWAA